MANAGRLQDVLDHGSDYQSVGDLQIFVAVSAYGMDFKGITNTFVGLMPEGVGVESLEPRRDPTSDARRRSPGEVGFQEWPADASAPQAEVSIGGKGIPNLWIAGSTISTPNGACHHA